MTYILEPLNEGDDMNCMLTFNESRLAVLNRAWMMVRNLQAALPGASISVRVSKQSKNLNHYTEPKTAVIVRLSGEVFKESNGKTLINLAK